MDGPDVTVLTGPDRQQTTEILALLEKVATSTGQRALSEHKSTELINVSGLGTGHGSDPGDRDAPDASVGPGARGRAPFVAVVARCTGTSDLVGYAHVSWDLDNSHHVMELAVDPATDDPDGVIDALLEAALDDLARHGGGLVRLWTTRAGPMDDQRALARGFRIERDLYQMRCPLPLPRDAGGTKPERGIETRPFRPGADEAAWLATNNRAFASHPEQGHWDMATLLEREKEPWFNADGLLMLEVDGRVAGSCWTRIHNDTDPPVGEIFVIGVDPDFHGRGWGRALTRAGLDWLARAGLSVGMLYVDTANVAAVTMYRSIGFVQDHIDRAYVATVDPR
jgi:mycothiol synthase